MQQRIVKSGIGAFRVFLVAAIGGAVQAQEQAQGPAFAQQPAAVAEGKAVRIAFAVDRESDVAVAILDAGGRVVRHLAAGKLGPKAPAPLAPGKLAQSLLWDRTDDDGRAVPAGEYRARVGLGLRPEFDRVFGADHRAVGRPHGLAVGRGGELYVMGEEGRDNTESIVRVFSREGNYLRTILPRPADIPLARALPLGEVVLDDGERFPTCLLPQYGARSYQAPVVTAAGDLILVNHVRLGHVETKRFRSVDFARYDDKGLAVHDLPPRRLLRIAADGGAPAAGVLGPVLGKGFENGRICLAEGADGALYVSGARHAVFRVKWGSPAAPEPFIGTPDTPGSGNSQLRDPGGIAFDARGRLFVADTGNHRVAIFDAAGKPDGQIAVEWPRQVLVSRATGAVYVAAGYSTSVLLKYASPAAARPAASFALGAEWPVVALDDGGASGAAAIYAFAVGAGPGEGTIKARSGRLVRLIDDGDSFRLEREISSSARPRQPLLAGVDRERELVYGYWPFESYWRMDGRTGRVETFDIPLHPKANGISEISVGARGNVIVHVTGEIARLGPDLAPLPFAATGSFIAGGLREDVLRSLYAKDCCETPGGDILRIHERGGYDRPFLVSEIKADGTPGRDSVVTLDSASAGGIRVDRQGCIYLLEHLKPVGQPVPPELAGKTPGGKSDAHVQHYGSILKFRPQGGTVRKLPSKGTAIQAGEIRFMTGVGDVEFAARGLEWSHYGVSILRSWHANNGCKCWTPRFDIDDYGLIFVPDQLRNRILVLDANGNMIATFGRYGNIDDKGPGVPLADPRTVMVSREAAYVGDMSNQRVVRVRLGYAAQAECRMVLESPAAAAPATPPMRPAVGSEQARAIDLLGLWTAPAGAEADARLTKALDDTSELVRVTAGYMLLRRGNAAGTAEVLRAARSKNPHVFKLAETAVLKEMVRWDADSEAARAIDPKTLLVPRFPVGKVEAQALLGLIDSGSWYLSRAALLMIGQSGSSEAAAGLLARIDKLKDRNLNRAIGALGVLRCQAAAPQLVAFVGRGKAANHGTLAYNGDEAEKYAAAALVRIADPACVAPLIALLDAAKPEVRELAQEALSRLFGGETAGGRRLLPRDGRLEAVRLDELPAPAARRAAWEAFWKAAAGRYETNRDGSGLRGKGAN